MDVLFVYETFNTWLCDLKTIKINQNESKKTFNVNLKHFWSKQIEFETLFECTPQYFFEEFAVPAILQVCGSYVNSLAMELVIGTFGKSHMC